MQDKLGPLTFVSVCHWKLEYFLRLHVVCVLKIQFTITWVWHLHSYPNHPTPSHRQNVSILNKFYYKTESFGIRQGTNKMEINSLQIAHVTPHLHPPPVFNYITIENECGWVGGEERVNSPRTHLNNVTI